MFFHPFDEEEVWSLWCKTALSTISNGLITGGEPASLGRKPNVFFYWTISTTVTLVTLVLTLEIALEPKAQSQMVSLAEVSQAN